MESTTAAAPATPQVTVGIDFGTRACVVQVCTEGRKVSMIHDEEFSKEDTISVVSFADNRRFVGEAAASQLRSNIANTAVELPRLVTLIPGEYPASRHAATKDSIEVAYNGETVAVTPVQLVAALFAKMKAEVLQKHEAVDSYTISVPPSFTAVEKRRILDGARIAGLSVSRLISSTTASVYAHCARHPETDATVLIVDVGSGYASASIATYEQGSATVLASQCDAEAGSRVVDLAIFNMVAEECQAKHGVEVQLCSPLGQRLMAQAASTKKILSTVGEAALFLEGVVGDTDMTVKISKAVLNDACKEYTTRLTDLVSKAVTEAEVPITRVEIIGGGSCVPMAQAAVTAALSSMPEEARTLGHTLDLTASIGYGAALAAWSAAGAEGGIVVTEKAAWDEGLEEAPALTDEEVQSAVAWEASVVARETEIKATEKARNDMEQLVYEMRAECSGRLKEHINSEGTMAELQSLEDWIWSDEGEAAGLQACQAKLEAVKAKLSELNPAYYKTMEDELVAAKAQAEEEAKRWAAEAANGPADGVNKDTRKLKFPDRMKLVQSNKAEATELFKDGNTEHAAMRYVKALNHCESFFDLNEEQSTELKTVKAALYNNVAMCYLKLQKWIKARENCNYVLEIDPDNAKAMFRRAQANTEEKKWKEAEVDLKRALELQPDDKGIARQLQIVAKGKKKENDKAKKMCGKMFG